MQKQTKQTIIESKYKPPHMITEKLIKNSFEALVAFGTIFVFKRPLIWGAKRTGREGGGALPLCFLEKPWDYQSNGSNLSVNLGEGFFQGGGGGGLKYPRKGTSGDD